MVIVAVDIGVGGLLVGSDGLVEVEDGWVGVEMECSEDSGVSRLRSSLMLEEEPLGRPPFEGNGGGVRVRSSAMFQWARLLVERVAWKEKVLDERRLAAEISLAIVISSDNSPEPVSLGPAVAVGRRLGEDVVVVACDGVMQMLFCAAAALSLSRT